MSVKLRVVGCVEEWVKEAEKGRPTSKHLKRIWERTQEIKYNGNAKRELIDTLRDEFSKFSLRLKPSNLNGIKSVQNIIAWTAR